MERNNFKVLFILMISFGLWSFVISNKNNKMVLIGNRDHKI